MADQVTPLKTRTENCLDETILRTPFPEATSTANNNLTPCRVSPKPVRTSETTVRLTNTIKELESFTKALSNAGKMSFGRNRSVLADTETDQSFDSNSSLGILDIDKLLENETMDDSQDVINSLYQIRDRRMNLSFKGLGKPEAISKKDSIQPNDRQKLSSKDYQNQTCNGKEYTMDSCENSIQGVPSRFLASESYISEGPSIDSQSFTARNDLSMGETSGEVAAIMQTDPFVSLAFEPSELSARSTSIGGSGENSRKSDFGLPSMSKNNLEMGFDDEEFLKGEDLIKKLECDEKSLTSKELPPIIPGCIPNPQKLDISTFSGSIGEGQIVVRPSWIGLEGYGDEPINMSVTEYFRLKSDVLSDTIDVHGSCGGERPNFGMEIKSPVKKGRRMALVSESFDASVLVSNGTTCSKLNETQVLSTPNPRETDAANVSESTDENPSYISSVASAVPTPSITCINNILNEIDVNDSPDTMARKFLEYTTSSRENKPSYDKNITTQTPSNGRASVNSQQSSKSKRNIDRNQIGKTHDKAVYLRCNSADSDVKDGKRYGVSDLLEKFNSVELGHKGNVSSLEKLRSMVQSLKQNSPGPLDCSALYESLVNESIISSDSMQAEMKFASPKEVCDKDQQWVKIPEVIMLPVEGGDGSKKQHCVGIGSTFHVPITNVTSAWLKFEVTFLKNKSSSNVVVQKLPIPTLISPESCVEFEAIVAPMSSGNHSLALEIKVTNFMAQEKSAQVYICQLILEANIPKVMLMDENMKEINDGNTIEFGLLPENCSKNIQLLILNVGKSDVPIRVVIEEMPSLLHPFEISGATRTPSADSEINYEGCPSKDGFSLERRDLLACDLLGSGPNSILAVSLMFTSPNIKEIPHTSAHNKDASKTIKLTAKLKVELDVPSTFSSNLRTLKEIQLCGSVGDTNLIIGVASEPVTLYSEEIMLPLSIHNQKIYKVVSEYIPICNSGVVPLQLKIFIQSLDGNESQEGDVMTVNPNNLSILPGEKFDVVVTYHPNTNKIKECDRILILQVLPNGPFHKVQLRGMPFVKKAGHSMERKENRPKLQTTKSLPPRFGMSDIIQASHTALVWGSVPVGSDGTERGVALKNMSDMVLRLSLRVNGTDDFKFLNHNSDCVGQATFDILPKKAEKLKFYFRPKTLGPICGKLSISVCDMTYPERCMLNKMIILLGYGGHCKIEAVSLPKDLAGRLWLNLGLISSSFSANPAINRSSRPSTPSSSFVKNRIQIFNSGTLPSLVRITPLKLGVDLKLLSNLEEGREHHVTIKPDEFELAPSSCITVWVTYVHGIFSTDLGSSKNQDGKSSNKGSTRIQEEVAKLLVVSGDVPTSLRLQRIWKKADVTSNIKISDLCCDMNPVKLNFIDAATSKDEFQSEGNEDYNKEPDTLNDPLSKEALNSLVQNVSSFEVMLAIEKIENSDEDSRHSVGDLTLALESSSVEFHPLMDDGDTNLFQIPQGGSSCDGRRKDGDFRSNKAFDDAKGKRDLFPMENLTSVRTHNYRENVFADTSAVIFPLTKVGDKSSGKLSLKNISSETYEVEFSLPSGPFIPPKKKIVISGLKHVTFRIKFEPHSAGFYETTMVMKARSNSSASENVIIVSLKGRAAT